MAVLERTGVETTFEGATFHLDDGDVVIAAITSCTNTSNPDVMVAAGLVARKAREKGLTRKPWVKTSLAPGSQVVTEYLEKAGLLDDLEAPGFYMVGYGCTTCIGNSGPLPEPISEAIDQGGLVVASVLSGNRNFEGRIHPEVRANYLASPPLVVAYALAGTVDIDLPPSRSTGSDGERCTCAISGRAKRRSPMGLREPHRHQFTEQVRRCLHRIGRVAGDRHVRWCHLSNGPRRTYIQEPPFFQDLPPEPLPRTDRGARVLVKLGDSVTTDHISPAGSIKPDSPAGKYLIERGVSRRLQLLRVTAGQRPGDDERDLRQHPGPQPAGPRDRGRVDHRLPRRAGQEHLRRRDALPEGRGAAGGPRRQGLRDGLLAGLGCQRDLPAWGEGGPRRELRADPPLQPGDDGRAPAHLCPGESAATLGLDGTETFDIEVDDKLAPRQPVAVRATRTYGNVIEFVDCRVDTPIEVDYFRNGGILHTVLRRMAAT